MWELVKGTAILYSQFYIGWGTVGILEDHGNFWGPWEICPACILQFQFLSYMRHYICYQSSQSFQSSQRFCPLQRRSFFFKLLELGTSFLRLQELRFAS